MTWRRLAWIAVIFATFLVSRPATAQRPAVGKAVTPPGSTPVLTFESEDAEEQADSFSIALRNRLKVQAGYIASEGTFSLAILTAALRCRPDPACMQRLGDQMKTDRFFWGRVTRAGKNQVTAEAHFWQRGKPESVIRETYSDELHDAASEALQRIANRVFERLTGTQTTGTVIVRAGNAGGMVSVDGNEADKLTRGQTTIDLKPGPHIIEVRVPGYMPAQKNVTVSLGVETPLTFTLSLPPELPPSPEVQAANASTRRLVAYGLLGAGGVAVIVSVVQAVRWFVLKSDATDLKQEQYGINPDRVDPHRLPVNVQNPCDGYEGALLPARQRMADACNMEKDARSISTIGWVAGSAGIALAGAGAFLLFTTPPNSAGKAARARPVRVFPSVGPHEGMLQVGATF